ncbi:MAG: coenzyme F430 synthase [Methanosarcinales archaeon]|nr:coenzyme F430 synthase [Methanosarcinales archaeon]
MHSHSGLSEGSGISEVAVLDTIHGGEVIARRMVEQGMQAEALEVYHSAPSVEPFDLVVSPVHLRPDNPALARARKLGKRIITHHQAVGRLVGDPGIPAFEVTGTRGKTTTALLLARILSHARMRVVSHTTRGIELWDGRSSRLLQGGLSITPANVILAAEASRSERADALVCEVSLGGTGMAGFGVLTSFARDYRIAGESMWASTAKLQMITLAREGFRLVAGVDTGISADLSFGPGGDVFCTGERICRGEEQAPLGLGQGFDPATYQSSISAAAAAAISAGLSLSQCSNALDGFDGLEGRMKRSVEEGMVVYDNSNSGLLSPGVERALDYAAGGGRLGLVVGEEAETVCEGMDVPALLALLASRREEIDELVLVGARLQPHARKLGARAAPDLNSGRRMARESLGRGDRMLLCVKCFR